MPRQPRCEPPSGIFHVTARGAAKADIFRADADRHRFLRLLDRAIASYDLRCLSYCLMGNHYHLLIETQRPTLGQGMKALNGRYAQWFNGKYGRSGHLFGARYHAQPMSTDAQMLLCLRYIARNPVRAGLVKEAAQWRWSAHRALMGATSAGLVAVDPALAHFSNLGPDPRAAYAAFVDAPDRP